MLFGAPRHVVSLIRSSINTDAIWCTPTCGINYSVSHHDGCRLVHPDMWYQLNSIRHHDGCRLVHPAKWEHFFNAYAIMTDADWCIPPSGTLDNFGCLHDGCRLVHPVRWFIRYIVQFHIYDGFRLMNLVFIIIQIHLIFKYHISIPYSLSYRLFKDIHNLRTHFIYSFTYSFIYSFMYSFQILIHILLHILISCTYFIFTHSHTHSYTHSCTYFIYLFHIYSFTYSFIYSFMYLFHIYLVNYQNT